MTKEEHEEKLTNHIRNHSNAKLYFKWMNDEHMSLSVMEKEPKKQKYLAYIAACLGYSAHVYENDFVHIYF